MDYTNALLLASVPYRDGAVGLSDTHLLFLRPNGAVRLAFALKHLSDTAVEYEHSFRHRVLGLLCAVLLLAASVVLLGLFLAGPLIGRPRMAGRIGFGAIFAFLFGMLFLVGVIRSRRVYWLCFHYARVRRQVDLPNVVRADLQRLVVLLPDADTASPVAFDGSEGG
jgi:hypothetical protein